MYGGDNVVGWTEGFSCLRDAAFAAGLAPALQLFGRDVGGQRGGVRSGSDFRVARISQALVLIEVTLSTIALTVGALIVHEMYDSYRLEFLRVWKRDPGAALQFEPFDQPANPS